MKIIDFTTVHVEQAAQIAKQNYDEESRHCPALPPVNKIPDLTPFAKNNLGVAVFEDDTMLGFLCGHGVWNNAWDISGLRHVYSPMGANGTLRNNRSKIYARLYEAVSSKWVQAGAASHGICLYAHDIEAQKQFFHYGFGMRTVDAIRNMDEIIEPVCEGYNFSELVPENVLEILPLENMLKNGFSESPTFMYKEPSNEKEFMQNYYNCNSIYFVAKYNERIIAFIRAEHDGETFIHDVEGYIHINAAYCLPEHRGKGISQKLLNLLVQKLKKQGYSYLGVDYESINPSGFGFWEKNFNPYTYGVVRRIDESIFNGGPS